MSDYPQGRSDYNPRGRRALSAPTPQTDPELFSNEDIMAEVRYLQSLNKRYGSNALRTLAYRDLLRVIEGRRARWGLCGR